jgi:putative hemolysin
LVDAPVYFILGTATIISFWASLVEATYLTVRPLSLASASSAGNVRASKALTITHEKTKLVSTTTFLDTVSNVVLASTIGLAFSEVFGPIGWVYSAVVGSLIIMILLILLPKAVGIENPVRMAIFLAPSSQALLNLFAPIAVPMTSFARSLSQRIIGKPAYKEEDLVNEFEDMLGMLEKAGHIEPDAGKILRSAMSSSKSIAGDALTPIGEIIAVDVSSNVQDALKLMGKSNHPRLPVYDRKSDQYVGAVTFRSLSGAMAAGKFSDNITDHMVQPARVETDESVATVMDRMQKVGATIAFVYDNGGMVGVITLTDILERILGVKV